MTNHWSLCAINTYIFIVFRKAAGRRVVVALSQFWLPLKESTGSTPGSGIRVDLFCTVPTRLFTHIGTCHSLANKENIVREPNHLHTSTYKNDCCMYLLVCKWLGMFILNREERLYSSISTQQQLLPFSPQNTAWLFSAGTLYVFRVAARQRLAWMRVLQRVWRLPEDWPLCSQSPRVRVWDGSWPVNPRDT